MKVRTILSIGMLVGLSACASTSQSTADNGKNSSAKNIKVASSQYCDKTMRLGSHISKSRCMSKRQREIEKNQKVNIRMNRTGSASEGTGL
ncbi:MAG: hypothetical protein COB35_09385 [Gammaproteobacteria bacterium]|nr:MAG: hypothetical protein COB35_09385 [Gammaproteobacteria bacterium]